MRNERRRTRDVLRANLAMLMRRRDWKARDVSERCTVSFRQVHNILNGTSTPSSETIDDLASAFGLKGWQLMLPNVPEEILDSRALAELVTGFLQSDDEGRDLALRILVRRAIQ